MARARVLVLFISAPQIIIVGVIIRGVKAMQKYPFSAQRCPVLAGHHWHVEFWAVSQ
jgi:hypothetical protein